MTKKFEVGYLYSAGSGDYTYTFKVVKRTAKYVWVTEQSEWRSRLYNARRGIYVHGGTECFMPFGRYSQAPVCMASKGALG